MRPLIGAIRLLLAAAVILGGVVACALVAVMSRTTFDKLAMRWHLLMLRCLGVRPRLRGAELVDGALILSNHISWLDISLFGAHWRVVFLANGDIAHWPILGWIIRRAGTLFIARGKGALQAGIEIGNALKRGRNVILFPEGKTTDGRSVIRFQPRLVQAAIDADKPIQPAALRYFDDAGRRVVRHSFAGGIGLIPSVWKTVCGARITAEITLFAPLSDGKSRGENRQALTGQAEAMVRKWVESEQTSPKNH